MRHVTHPPAGMCTDAGSDAGSVRPDPEERFPSSPFAAGSATVVPRRFILSPTQDRHTLTPRSRVIVPVPRFTAARVIDSRIQLMSEHQHQREYPHDPSHPKHWVMRASARDFFEAARIARANGSITETQQRELDRHEPGWYDEWLDAPAASVVGRRRRNAVIASVLPDGVEAFHDADHHAVVFVRTSTGRRIDVTLMGSDDQMRQQARGAIKKLLHPYRNGLRLL